MADRTSQDRRIVPAAPTGTTDLLDRTARQVRLDYKGASVHQLLYDLDDPWTGRVYHTRCVEALSKAEGGILTTRDVDCHWCLTGEQRPNR